MSLVWRPPVWAVLLTTAGMLLTANLAWWQYQRGIARQAILAMHADAAKQSPQLLASEKLPTESQEGARIAITGQFQPALQLYLDNQVSEKKPGYHVWTPLLTSAGLVVVNRGWVPMSLDRNQLPSLETPEAVVTVNGLWQHLPEPGMRLGQPLCSEDEPQHPPTFPVVVQYPAVEELRCLFRQPVAAGQLLLDADADFGFRRQWKALGLPPQRHYGYALQWLALTLTQFVLLIILNVRRR